MCRHYCRSIMTWIMCLYVSTVHCSTGSHKRVRPIELVCNKVNELSIFIEINPTTALIVWKRVCVLHDVNNESGVCHGVPVPNSRVCSIIIISKIYPTNSPFKIQATFESKCVVNLNWILTIDCQINSYGTFDVHRHTSRSSRWRIQYCGLPRLAKYTNPYFRGFRFQNLVRETLTKSEKRRSRLLKAGRAVEGRSLFYTLVD